MEVINFFSPPLRIAAVVEIKCVLGTYLQEL